MFCKVVSILTPFHLIQLKVFIPKKRKLITSYNFFIYSNVSFAFTELIMVFLGLMSPSQPVQSHLYTSEYCCGFIDVCVGIWFRGLIKLTFFLGNSNNSMAMVKLINLLLRIHNTQEKDSYIVLKVQGLVETVL